MGVNNEEHFEYGVIEREENGEVKESEEGCVCLCKGV